MFQLQMMTMQNSTWKEMTVHFWQQCSHEYGNVGLRYWSLWLDIHDGWFIRSDKTVNTQRRESCVPEDTLSQVTSQGEPKSRRRSWGDKAQHPCTFSKCISWNTNQNILNSALSIHPLSRKCSRNSIFQSTLRMLHCAGLFLPESSVRVSPACMTAAEVMQVGAGEKNKSLVEAALQCGSRWQPEGSWKMAAGMGATQTAFFCFNIIARQLWGEMVAGAGRACYQ